MSDWTTDLLWLLFALFLVVANGFFVAAEFALVKLRASQVDTMVEQGRPFSGVVHWLMGRLDATLAACQLGITMASLGLGWVGEPAFARLLEPVFDQLGMHGSPLVHTISFAIAFTLITTLHIVIGEQVPKIYAIRNPDTISLASAWPMKIFYYISYPFMIALNGASNFLLRRLGIRAAGHHDDHHSEKELRGLLKQAYARGEMSRSEHRLLNAVFELDDMVGRRIMVPRSDVVYLEASQSLAQWVEILQKTRHTRYPVCDGSLDQVVGIVHFKDLVGLDESEFKAADFVRPALSIPETMRVDQLLRHFQDTHQHMAMVVDEFGNMIGLVTLENVLEQIVGSVEDEFDDETPKIVQEAPGRFLVRGMTPFDVARERLNLEVDDPGSDIETFSGFLTVRRGQILEVGDTFEMGSAKVEIVEMYHGRATQIRVTQPDSKSNPASESSQPPSA